MAKTIRIFLLLSGLLFVVAQTGSAQTESFIVAQAPESTPIRAEAAKTQKLENTQAEQMRAAPPAAPQNPPMPAQPQRPRRLTLEGAISAALAQHPSLTQARAAISAEDARTGQARSGFFPQVSTSGFAKQGLSGASGALGLRGLVTSPLFRDIGASAAILQNVYDFGRTAHMVKASTWASTSLRHALEAQEALVTLNVRQAYYNALEQQQLIKVAERTLADQQLIVRQAGVFYKTGVKSKVDLTLAEVGASKANLELVQARDLLSTAYAQLNNAMGLDGDPGYDLEEPDIKLEQPPPLEPLLPKSLQQRPDLLALDAETRVGEELVARAESNRWPKLMLLFSSGWVRFSDYSPGKLLLGAFGVDLPIFTAGQIKNQIAEAKANLAQTKAAREVLALNVRLQVQRAHTELLSAIEAVKATDPLTIQAREAVRLAQIRYRTQLGSLLELTTAQTEATSAEAKHAEALYRYKMAQALLNYAAGGQ